MGQITQIDQPTHLKHINVERSRWDQLYYEGLADSLTGLVRYALQQDDPSNQPVRILDIGCGRGELLQRLVARGYAAVGVDIEPACVAMASQYAQVVTGDVFSLESMFPPARFDVVIASHVLEHVENPRKAIYVMKHLSRRWIIIAVPNLLTLSNWFHCRPRYVNPGHLQGWDIHHLKTLLEKNCQLRIVRWWPDPIHIPLVRRTFLLNSPLLRFVENRFLWAILPQMANSLVVLCEPTGSE